MLKIGITGGIGSGKSTVCKIFEILGIPVYYADDRAKQVMNESPEVRSKIIQAFGKETYNEHGLNRSYLASVVFSDPSKTQLINSIVHPAVGLDFHDWCISKQGTGSFILKEAALMFESDSYKSLDKIICVSAPEAIRLERTLKRDPQRNEQDIKHIMDKQMPEEEKLRRSDFAILNDDKHLLIPQVLDLHKKLLELN